jgi:hypothetical protein
VKSNNKWQAEVVYNHKEIITTIQALPDGRILWGDYKGYIYISSASNNIWQLEEVGQDDNEISMLQAMPDGRIFSAAKGNAVKIRSKQNNQWQEDTKINKINQVKPEAIFPDGRIVSFSNWKDINIWSEVNGDWQVETIEGSSSPKIVKVLSDDRIVVAYNSGLVSLMTKINGIWQEEKIGKHKDSINNVEITSDGRIITNSFMFNSHNPFRRLSNIYNNISIFGLKLGLRQIQGPMANSYSSIKIWDGDKVE